MTGSIREVFESLIVPWAESDVFPQASVQAVDPAFAALFSSTPRDLDFDSWVHAGPRDGWGWRKLEFPEHFDGYFSLYLPDSWTGIARKGTAAGIASRQKQHQSIFLMQKRRWAGDLRGFLDKNAVIAFSYDAPHPPLYHRWIFATGTGKPDYWAWGVYSSGDHILLVKGDGRDAAEMQIQLTSLLNSNPWRGWIEAARRMSGRE